MFDWDVKKAIDLLGEVELKKQSSCSMQMTNKTAKVVAFKVKSFIVDCNLKYLSFVDCFWEFGIQKQ